MNFYFINVAPRHSTARNLCRETSRFSKREWGTWSFAFIAMCSILLTPSAANCCEQSKAVILGFTEPVRIVNLAASETGTLAELACKQGDIVAKGQIVGALDHKVLLASRAVAVARQNSKAKLNAANIRLARAKRNSEKMQELSSEGHGGRRELEIAKSEYELALADVEAVKEEKQLGLLEIQRIDAEIARRRITSSIQGVVSEVHCEVGEYVSANQPEVLKIVDLRQLRVRFYVPTALSEDFHEGDWQSVRFVHDGTISRAKVEYISPVINADSDTVQIDLLLNNDKFALRSGRRCEFVLTDAVPQTVYRQKQTSDTLRQGVRQ